MVKHLWRNHSYVQVEKEDPGCLWAVFQMMNYHPWHNAKKMLPYKKQKHGRSTKSKGRTNDHIDINKPLGLEDDEETISSASVMSSPSRNRSTNSKRSIKARIKALLANHGDRSTKVNSIQEHELLALEDKCAADLGAPTLLSLLKSNPKLMKAASHADEPRNLSRKSSFKHKDSKDEFVGVLELFKVNQDVFIKILQDSPPRKPRLAKSGSFPSANPLLTEHFGRTPSKIEHKRTEVWPLSNNGDELPKAKSPRLARSSSLEESLDRYGSLIDTTSNSKGIKKSLSKSLKLSTEKEFTLLSDQHGRRSFRERLYLPETECETPRASLDTFLNQINLGEARVFRLGSPRETKTLVHNEISAESHIAEKKSDSGVKLGESIQGEIVEMKTDCGSEINDGITSVTGVDDVYSEDHIELVDWPILAESPRMSSTLENAEDEMDNYNEDLQYVKYVLDIIGFTTADDQVGAWHLPDQPLDPALFDGIEICCPFESKSLKKEAIMSSSQRKVLFDLINEALVEVHEKSYAYYPKALSSSCYVRALPNGKNRIVEEVWEIVSQYLNWRPEQDMELNFAVAHDLSRHKNGWSNLQTDTELLAIDLEEWILNDLLDEIVS